VQSVKGREYMLISCASQIIGTAYVMPPKMRREAKIYVTRGLDCVGENFIFCLL
jgi:hypothetical protein